MWVTDMCCWALLGGNRGCREEFGCSVFGGGGTEVDTGIECTEGGGAIETKPLETEVEGGREVWIVGPGSVALFGGRMEED